MELFRVIEKSTGKVKAAGSDKMALKAIRDELGKDNHKISKGKDHVQYK